MPATLRRLLVVLAVVGAGILPAPAVAAGYCTTGSGVSVVVDFGALGGGIQKGCDDSGNRNAARAFTNTGHPLTYAQRQPGFVCRVNGVPETDPCVNTSPSDAYWGLYWSDGTSGWKYSSLGVGSLDVPAGATVAFSWQDGGTADPPGTSPSAPPAPAASQSASPTPIRTPTAKTSVRPTTKPAATAAVKSTTGPTGPAAATTAPTTSSASASASATPSATGTPSPGAVSATPATTPSTDGPAAVSEPRSQDLTPAAADGGGGLPWWVPVLVLLALAAGGGAAWWSRRRGLS